MTQRTTLIAQGAAGALGARALLVRAMLFKLRRDLASLNAGDYKPLLSGYADDAVLVFPEGEHRWSGEHRGKAAIEGFLQNFVAAGLQGTLGDLLVAGPPWALTLMARFDDQAHAPDGEELYSNRVAMLIRTRWGKIVRHEDFFADTSRIERFDRRLGELGVTARETAPVAA